jgi:hypothetical protein
MFCPKCGAQNVEGTRFCRGCGADVGSVLAVVEGRSPAELQLAEKYIDLYSRGWRGLVAGVGFLIVAGVSFGISMRLAVLGVFALMFAFVFLSAGISRFVQARALKRLREPKGKEQPPTLSPGEEDYIRPLHSIYETDDLVRQPGSVTEHTTTHLEFGHDPATVHEPDK